MTFRRLVIAAAVLLAAVIWKLTLPAFGEVLLPALGEVLGQEQVVFVVPDGMALWPGSG